MSILGLGRKVFPAKTVKHSSFFALATKKKTFFNLDILGRHKTQENLISPRQVFFPNSNFQPQPSVIKFTLSLIWAYE